MEIKAISFSSTKVFNEALVAYIKHNGRLVVLEVNTAGELVIKMSPAHRVIDYVDGYLRITVKE